MGSLLMKLVLELCGMTYCGTDSGLGVITNLTYVKVNPGVETSVTCFALRNPGLQEEDLELLGVAGMLSSSVPLGFGEKVYTRINSWMVTLQSDTVMVATCSIKGTNISQSRQLKPYELLQYSSAQSAPLNFQPVTSTSISLTWPRWEAGTDVGDGPVKEYVIEYREEGGSFMEGERTATRLTSTITSLKAGTLYEFRIFLVREGTNGTGPPSAIQSQRTLCGVFTMSPTLMLDSITSRIATFMVEIPDRIHWNCHSITVSLQRQESNREWTVVEDLSTSLSQVVDVIDLVPCTSYTFRLQLDNPEHMDVSMPVEVMTPPEALLVRDISVASIAIGQLDVSWLPPDTSQTNCALSSYTVMYRLVRHVACTSDVTESMYISNTASSTSRTLSGLSDYAEYEVKVRADGEVEGMEIIEMGTTLPAAPSAAPTDIMLANISSTCLRFTWKPPPCDQRNGVIMDYQYSLSLTNGTANDTLVTGSSTEDKDIKLCGLIPYFEYDFTVRAITTIGQGPDSEIVTSRTEEDVPPQLDPPRFLFTNASSLKLQWQSPYPPHGIIIGYNISVQLIDDNQSNMSFIVSVDAEIAGEPPSFILTNLEPLRNYSVMVRANTRIGPGNWSLGAISTTKEGLPSPPQNIKVSNKSKFSLTVEWDVPEIPAGDIIRYEICDQALEKPYNPDFKVVPCGPHTMIVSPHTHIVHRITSLEPSTVYRIEVSAYTSAGQGKISNITARTEIADEFIAVQKGDISQITRKGVLATLSLPPLTDMYATHYFIRVRNPQILRRSVGGIGSYDDNPRDYITAEIEKGDEGDPFTIGDGQMYGMYRNVPLEEDKEYEIYVGTGSRVGEDTEVVWSEPFPVIILSTAFPWIYIVIAVVISILIILFLGVFLIKRKISFKDKKATKADAGEDTDYVNAVLAMADGSEDYIPLDKQCRTVSLSKYEDLNHKPRDGASIPPQYEVTIVPQPQKPEATPKYKTRNMKEVNSGSYEDVGSEHRQLPDVPQPHPSPEEDEDNNYIVPDRLEEYTGVYSNIKAKPVQPGPIKVAEFQNFMSRNRDDVVNDIVQQFMALPSGGQHPWSVAQKFQNKPRNFFKTILAYDHSRVKLDTNGSDARSDYINASYIKQGKTSFIAAQGPQEGTVDDFWKMVWQENVEALVMVTDNIEKNKLLCCTYWPTKVHTSEVFDDITVLLMESTSYATHTIRKLNLLKGHHKAEVHTVTQIQVHSWPYGDVPKEPTSLISIIKKVKSLQTNRSSSPLLVHCSNGVGATGTFITVYVLMDTIKKNKDVNVFDCVKRMRDDRVNMVQTRIQYLFIFECLLAVLQSTDSQISYDQLKKLGHAAIKLKSEKEYKVLQESAIEQQHCENNIGNSPENQHKNRFKNLIPVDKFRPVLKSEGSLFGSNSYINGLHLTDYSGGEFIITQTPLSSTVEDFWRLVYDYDCTTIITLNTVDGSDETVVQYWPSGGGAQYGLMKVVCMSTANRDSCIQSQFKVAHIKVEEKSVSVDHFAFCGWSGNQPDVSKLRQFIRYTGNKSTGPVLVHCINGVGLSAVYVIVKTESERLEQEGSADVFQCLKKLRKICPHAIQTQEEYTLCYQLLKDHLDNPEEYAVVY